MGNRSSKPSSAQPQGTTVPDEDGSGARVFVAQDLSEEIYNTFSSKILQGQWEHHQQGILASHQERNTQYNAKREALFEDLIKWRTQNQQVQEKLNDTIVDLRIKFNDLASETENAMEKLDDKLKNAPKFGNEDQCLETRTGLARCYQESKDTRQCDIFMNALERCAKQEVMGA